MANGKWFLLSENGIKKLGGPYDTREEAKEEEGRLNRLKGQKSFSATEFNKMITENGIPVDSQEGQEYIDGKTNKP